MDGNEMTNGDGTAVEDAPIESSSEAQASPTDEVAAESGPPAAEASEPAPGTSETLSLEIPVRMLHVIRVAAKDNGRYCIDGVYVETRDSIGLIAAAATDGRRMVVAEWNRGLFDDEVHILVPGMVARNARSLATRARTRDDEPMATIVRKGEECTLTVFTTTGDVNFHWTAMELGFPPYREAIPDWSDSAGLARIAIKPELFYGALKTLQEVVGSEQPVKFYLPNTPDRAIGLEAQDGDTIKALAVIMPVKMDEWVGEPETQATELVDAPLLAAADESWRSVVIADLEPKLKPGKLKSLAEHNPPIVTMGDLVDVQAKGEWWWKNVKGLGDGGLEQITAACEEYWAKNPRGAVKPEPGSPLSWTSLGSSITALNTAGNVRPDNSAASFVVGIDEDMFTVTGSFSSLLPDSDPGPFGAQDEAKIWCAARNRELADLPGAADVENRQAVGASA